MRLPWCHVVKTSVAYCNGPHLLSKAMTTAGDLGDALARGIPSSLMSASVRSSWKTTSLASSFSSSRSSNSSAVGDPHDNSAEPR